MRFVERLKGLARRVDIRRMVSNAGAALPLTGGQREAGALEGTQSLGGVTTILRSGT